MSSFCELVGWNYKSEVDLFVIDDLTDYEVLSIDIDKK